METIFLAPDDIASLLKVSKAQVDRMIANEELPFTRYHLRVIVKLVDLITYIVKSHTTNSYVDSQDEEHRLIKSQENQWPSGNMDIFGFFKNKEINRCLTEISFLRLTTDRPRLISWKGANIWQLQSTLF